MRNWFVLIFACLAACLALGLFTAPAFAGKISFNATRGQVNAACKSAGGTSWTVDSSYGCQTSKGHVECTGGKCTGWCEQCGRRVVAHLPITTTASVLRNSMRAFR